MRPSGELGARAMDRGASYAYGPRAPGAREGGTRRATAGSGSDGADLPWDMARGPSTVARVDCGPSVVGR